MNGFRWGSPSPLTVGWRYLYEVNGPSNNVSVADTKILSVVAKMGTTGEWPSRIIVVKGP